MIDKTNTRTAILDAAEQLFSIHGFGATSIREITREAGANVAAVHYHFGSKEDVLRAVTDRIVTPLNARRIVLLDAVLRRRNPAPIPEILDAFIRPDVETLQELQHRAPTVAHFLGRIYSDQTPWIQRMARDQFRPSADQFLKAAAASLPHLDADEIEWRVMRVAAVIVHMFSTWPGDGMSNEAAAKTIDRYVAFLAPGLAAPVAKEAAAAD